MSAAKLEGRTCLITGATSGIGEATALGLARLGARVILVGRDAARGEASVAAVRRATGNDAVELLLADLASVAEVRKLAAAVLERAPQLHVLVNNAGMLSLRRQTTVDGYETTFADTGGEIFFTSGYGAREIAQKHQSESGGEIYVNSVSRKIVRKDFKLATNAPIYYGVAKSPVYTLLRRDDKVVRAYWPTIDR